MTGTGGQESSVQERGKSKEKAGGTVATPRTRVLHVHGNVILFFSFSLVKIGMVRICICFISTVTWLAQ